MTTTTAHTHESGPVVNTLVHYDDRSGVSGSYPGWETVG